eukprot:Pgem_evm1s8224
MYILNFLFVALCSLSSVTIIMVNTASVSTSPTDPCNNTCLSNAICMNEECVCDGDLVGDGLMYCVCPCNYELESGSNISCVAKTESEIHTLNSGECGCGQKLKYGSSSECVPMNDFAYNVSSIDFDRNAFVSLAKWDDPYLILLSEPFNNA